jgi:hypothetical protein
MLNLVPLLLALFRSAAGKIMLYLGLGYVSYTGVRTAASSAINLLISHYNAIDPDVLALLNLAGFGTALGIITASVLARIGLATISKAISVVDNLNAPYGGVGPSN